MEDKPRNPARRRVLHTTTGAAFLGLACTLLDRAAAQPAPAAAAPQSDAGAGNYRETSHIRKYYALARF